MMFLKSLSFLCIMVLGISAYASEETFGTFSHKLDSWAEGLSGVIVSVDGKKATIDLGSPAGIVKGMSFNVSKLGEELIHPVNGKSLGRKSFVIGVVTVDSVHDKYSNVTFSGEGILAPGDSIAIDSPIKAVITFEGLSESEKADASYAILKSAKFTESKDGAFHVSCTKKTSAESFASCALSLKGGAKIILAEVPVTSVVITTASTTVKKTEIEDADGAVFFENKFVSAAIGSGFGAKGDISVAAAEQKAVYIYSYTNLGGFKEAYILKDGFANIVNVELADLNGNGTDELFVSNMDSDGKVISYIFEYDGSRFVPLLSKTPYLFRTFYSLGKKTVICQQFEDGDFTGLVAPYLYVEGSYKAGDGYEGTLGMRLYGFAVTSAGDRIGFASSGTMSIEMVGGAKIPYRNYYFGDTPHKLRYSKEIITGSTKDADGNLTNSVENKIIGISVYQRIIEVSAGRFLLSGNIPLERKALGQDTYRSSFFGIYVLLDGRAESYWKLPFTLPAIIESDAMGRDGTGNVVILKNFKGGLISGGGSSLRILTVDVK